MVGDDYKKFRDSMKCKASKIYGTAILTKWKDCTSQERIETIASVSKEMLNEIEKSEQKDISFITEDHRR